MQNLLSARLPLKNLKIKIYRTITLLVVLYGCATWSLTLKKEHSLRVFESGVLWRIFGPKRDEVTGEWRKLHKEELYDCTHQIFRCSNREELDGRACSTYGGEERCIHGFGGVT